jgi:hypothetical protein
MDDSYFNNGIVLCTDSYSRADQERLAAILNSKYGLTVNLHKKKTKSGLGTHRLYITKSSVNNILIPLIKDQIHPSMLYKLGL